MIFRLALALLGLGATLGTVSDCGAGKGLFTITELSQDPASNVVAGQNVSLTLKYTSPEEISGGTATTSVTLNFIPFSPSVEDLCTKATCPITVGEHDGSSWGLFPSGVTGTVVSKVEWKDPSGRLLLCIQSKLAASSENSLALIPYSNRTFEDDFGMCPANHTDGNNSEKPMSPSYFIHGTTNDTYERERDREYIAKNTQEATKRNLRSSQK